MAGIHHTVSREPSVWLVLVVAVLISVVLVVPATATAANPGEVDLSFGSSGSVIIDFGGVDVPSALGVDPQDRIVAGGTAVDASTNDSNVGLVRLLPDGTPDPSFGTVGIVQVDVGRGDFAAAVDFTADGKMVVAGRVYHDENTSSGGWYQASLKWMPWYGRHLITDQEVGGSSPSGRAGTHRQRIA